jgi:hypothetical protein
MSKQIRVAAVAAAVGAVFAGTSGIASAAGTTTIYGAGASAVKNAVQLLVLKDYCAAGTITFYDNGTGTISAGAQPGGSIFLISCTASSTAGLSATTVNIGYDTSGGSWKAFTSVNTALYTSAGSQSTFNANPVATVQTAGGTMQSNIAMAVLGNTFTINYVYGSPTRALVPGTDVVSYGLTDVEDGLFLSTGDNQPLQNNTWATTSVAGPVPLFSSFGTGTELAGFPTQVFGVVLGVGASPKLYSALQADQIATGLLPSTCTAGTVSSPAATCAPNITRAQYASIAANSGGALNASLAALFTSVVPSATTFELARRDQGSGTQASSNAYFLNDGCSNLTTEAGSTPQLPYGSAGNVSYNASTSAAQGKIITPTLDGGTGFAIGIVSVENESKWTGGSGFLKLDGFYPSAANAAVGRYGYVSEENLHFNPSATGDALQFSKDLTATSGSKVNESTYNYGVGLAANGIVGIYSALNPNATWGNGGLLCSGWQHL